MNSGSIPLVREPVRPATRRMADLANERGVPVAFDMKLREHLWPDPGDAREAVDPLLDLSTVVKTGDDELAPLLGTGEVEEAARALLDRGVPLVLISMGSEGAFYATREFSGTVPTFEVEEVVDATGAGDAFLAAALVHLSGRAFDEEHVREAVRRGRRPRPHRLRRHARPPHERRARALHNRWRLASGSHHPVTEGGNMEKKPNLSSYCVYTMRHTDWLEKAYRAGGSGTVIENKRWVQGERLFREAQRNDERMPVVFTAAEKDGGLIYYAFLDVVDVEDGSSQTTYSFSGLTPFDEERPKSSLTKRSDGKPLSDAYIRPYAICFTPDLL